MAEGQIPAVAIYGLPASQHNACVAQLGQGCKPALQKKGGTRLRRLLSFPVAAAVTAAMVVVSAVPALGDYLERLAGPENEH